MKKRIIIALVLLLAGCDLVTTRPPEPPGKSSSNNITATSESALFDNLIASFKEGIVENYIACFADTTFTNNEFVFIPSSDAKSLPAFDSWDIESERLFFRNLKTAVKPETSITLELLNENVNHFGGDSSLYQYDYSLRLSPNDASLSSEYKGSAQFKTYKGWNQQFVIGEWRDIKVEGYPSLSELKGRLSN